MKIRNGFVSNSSSTSFCIYGASMSYSTLNEKGEAVEKADLDYHQEYQESDTAIVGRNPDSLKDDETGAQFKQSVKDKLKEIFGEEFACDWHQDGWYNG